MRIGLYGGSFNPVHHGHINIARRAIAELQLDRLIVLPAAVNPFKVGLDHSVAALNRDWELKLVTAAFAAVEKAVVDMREVNRGGVSYAIETVREVAAENPGAELYYIIGEDSVEGLPRWKEIDELKKLVTFKAYPRTPESSTAIRELFNRRAVTINEDEKLAAAVREGVLRKNGFCPCRLPKNPEFFCPCEEFRAQLADPSFSGLCHCRLYNCK